jgi:hypothetical protein
MTTGKSLSIYLLPSCTRDLPWRLGAALRGKYWGLDWYWNPKAWEFRWMTVRPLPECRRVFSTSKNLVWLRVGPVDINFMIKNSHRWTEK